MNNKIFILKKLLGGGYRAGVVLICSAIVGLFLLLAVYSIPTERIDKNVEKSALVFLSKDRNRAIDFGGITGGPDLFTDAIMLLHAAYSGNESLLDKVINVYSEDIDGLTPNGVLIEKYLNGQRQGRKPIQDIGMDIL